ncbi:MAG: T9SS type A sorting domain-containing protein [Rhodothermia bacterium]
MNRIGAHYYNLGVVNKPIVSLLIVSSLLLAQPAGGQAVFWEQKLDLHFSCTPDAIVSILAIAAGEDGTVYASDQTYLYRTFDDGDTWEKPAFQPAHIEGIVVLDSDSLLIGVVGTVPESSGVFRVGSHGDSWEKTDIEIPIEFMTSRPDNSVIYATGWITGLFVSTNHGHSWLEVFPNTIISGLVAGNYGLDYLMPGPRVSSDGLVWDLVTNATALLYPTSTQGVFLSPDSDGIYRSTNGGWTWTRVLEAKSAILITNRSGDILSVAHSGEASISSDDGQTWMRFAEPIPDSCGGVSVVTLDSSGHIWSGTVNGAVFRTSESTVVSNGRERIGTPSNSSSLDIFPNPASGFIRVSVTTVSPGYSRLEIYDLLGRLVKTLHSGFLSQGNHSFRWDGADLTNGYYLVRYVSETASQHAVLAQVAG